MKAHKDFLLDQQPQFEAYTNDLTEFVGSEEFSELSVQEQSYLEAELPLMQQLSALLKSHAEAQKVTKEAEATKKKSLEVQAKAAPKDEVAAKKKADEEAAKKKAEDDAKAKTK